MSLFERALVEEALAQAELARTDPAALDRLVALLRRLTANELAPPNREFSL